MRNYTILLSTVLLSISYYISAQDIVKENKLWSYTTIVCDGPDVYHSNWILFTGDTIINDTAFLKVFKSTDEFHNDWSAQGAVREDTTGKVFLHQNNRQKLLYDFSVELGDTLKNFEGGNDEYYVVNVEYIHPEAFEDSLKKIDICSFKDCNYVEGTWIEGIGSLHGILSSVELIGMVGGGSSLVCMFENNTLKYHNDYFTECFPQGYPENIETAAGERNAPLIFYMEDQIVFEFEGDDYHDAAFRVFDIAGRVVCTYTLENEILTIQKADFRSGIYLYTCMSGSELLSGKFIVSE